MQNKLRYYRKKKLLSQSKLADTSGVSRPTISKIESGNAEELKTSTMVKLADALGVAVADIFFV